MQAGREAPGGEVPRPSHDRRGEVAMPDERAVDQAATSLRLLGDPTRMKLLWALSKGASHVSRLAELVGATPTAASQHLAKLRLAGLVTAERRGSFVYYSVVDGHVTRLVSEAVEHAAHGLPVPGRTWSGGVGREAGPSL